MSGGGRRSGPGVSPARNGSKWIRPARRAAIYARDDYQCLYCGARTPALTLDHYRGHSNESSNLITCCLSCNSAKQNLSVRAWWERLRARTGWGVKESRQVQGRIRRQLRKKLVTPIEPAKERPAA